MSRQAHILSPIFQYVASGHSQLIAPLDTDHRLLCIVPGLYVPVFSWVAVDIVLLLANLEPRRSVPGNQSQKMRYRTRSGRQLHEPIIRGVSYLYWRNCPDSYT